MVAGCLFSIRRGLKFDNRCSVTGLWAARLCADHFEDVVIVEPEAWLSSEEARTAPFNEKGEKNFDGKRSRTRVMQYTSAHG